MKSGKIQKLRRSHTEHGSRNTSQRQNQCSETDDKNVSDQNSETETADEENDRQKEQFPNFNSREIFNMRNPNESSKYYYGSSSSKEREAQSKDTTGFNRTEFEASRYQEQFDEEDNVLFNNLSRRGHQGNGDDVHRSGKSGRDGDDTERNDDERHRQNGNNFTNENNDKSNSYYKESINKAPRHSSTIHMTEPRKLPSWREFDGWGFKEFFNDYNEHVSQGGFRKMNNFITIKVQHQSKIQFNDLLKYNNNDLVNIINEFFKITSLTKVEQKLNKLSMNKYENEPTINNFNKYSKAFSLIINEVDIRFRPSTASTIRCYIDGLYPKTLRMKVKNEDPKSLAAADCLARSEVQAINESNDKIKQYKYTGDSYNYNANNYYSKNYNNTSRNEKDRNYYTNNHNNQQQQQHRNNYSSNNNNQFYNRSNFHENRSRGTKIGQNEVSGRSLKNNAFSHESREPSRDRSPSVDRNDSKPWPRNQDNRDHSRSPGSQDSSRSHRSRSSDYDHRHNSRDRSGSSEKIFPKFLLVLQINLLLKLSIL